MNIYSIIFLSCIITSQLVYATDPRTFIALLCSAAASQGQLEASDAHTPPTSTHIKALQQEQEKNNTRQQRKQNKSKNNRPAIHQAARRGTNH